MKNIMIILAAALLLSCSTEKSPESVTSPEFDKFTAIFADRSSASELSKTVLNDDMTVGWAEGDEVMVYNGVAAHRFIASLAGTSNAKAELTPENKDMTLKRGNSYYALYPYEESARWGGTSVTFNIPAMQKSMAGTFSYNPSVSYTTSSEMSFRNICALVEFSVSSDNVSKIVFEGCNGEDLAGKVVVDCKAYPPTAKVLSGSRSVTVEGEFDPDVKYYVAILPNEFKKGLKTTSYDRSGNTYTKESEPFELLRSSRIELGIINEYIPFKPEGHPVLFFDYDRGQEVKATLTGSHSESWQRAVLKANSYMQKTPTEYKGDTGEQLWQRDVGNIISSLAFVGYMAEDKRYVDKAYVWAQKCGSYPTWGTDNTPDGQEYGLAYGHQLLGLAMLYDYGQGFLSKTQLEEVKEIMLSRVRRLYAAYSTVDLHLLTNHCWINICGMLAPAVVLKKEVAEAEIWEDFALNVMEAVSRLLIKDGVSQEGPGYWQYGMEFLMMNFDIAKSLGHDLYAGSSQFWQNTAKFEKFFTVPLSYASQTESLIDWGDARRVSWYGPLHLFHRLASLNNDSIAQTWAEEAVRYDVSSSWLDVLWYDPSIEASVPDNMPSSHHFEEMDIFASRTGWSGNESLIIYRCGSPLGKSAASNPGYTQGDLGHIHPDAGHFIIYDKGEYIIRNTGYVKRQSKYHNTVLFSGNGLYGDKQGYFTPWPLTPSKYPSITSVSSDEDMDVITSDMSSAYNDAASVRSYTRKFIWYKKKNIVVLVDDVECSKQMDIQVRLYPESQEGTCSGNVYTTQTDVHNVRIENLSSAAVLEKTVQPIEDRQTSNTADMSLLTISQTAQKCRIVTAISWSDQASTPIRAFYDEQSGNITLEIDETDSGNSHEGFDGKSSFDW